MSKRPSTPDSLPAAQRLKHNVDAMGCLIMTVTRENQALRRELNEAKESCTYLHRQVERLDAYTNELECRLSAMEAVISNLLTRPIYPEVLDAVAETRAEGDHLMDDLDRLIAEADTDDDGELMRYLFE